jgi:hypothetical protein
VSEPTPPCEVEFLQNVYVDGDCVGSDLIALGLEPDGGNVVVPRTIGGKPAVTIWLHVCDAAEELEADHVNYRNPYW